MGPGGDDRPYQCILICDSTHELASPKCFGTDARRESWSTGRGGILRWAFEGGAGAKLPSVRGGMSGSCSFQH